MIVHAGLSLICTLLALLNVQASLDGNGWALMSFGTCLYGAGFCMRKAID